MKKTKSLLTFIIATITTIVLISVTPTTASASYEFDVISDTHIGADMSWNASTKLDTTLKCIKKSYPNSKCIVVNGDVVDNCQQSSYNTLSEIINRNKSNLPFMYFNFGNHEFVGSTNGSDPATQATYKARLNTFNSKINSIQRSLSNKGKVTTNPRDNSYNLQYVNNNRFVFLGTDEIVANNSAYLNPSYQLNWLSGSCIKPNTAEGKKPMFLFLHQPIQNTTYGSSTSDPHVKNWGNLWNSSTLIPMLNGHPEIIMFTSHTHTRFNGTYGGNNFYSLGSNSASIFSTSSVSESSTTIPEGYHVTVYSDGVVVKGVQYFPDGSCKEISTRTVNF